MSERVPSTDIEHLVGAVRHPHLHKARAVSCENEVYLLHSQGCLNMDLRYERRLQDCPFSLAMDQGIPLELWTQDEALVVDVVDGLLVPHPAFAEGSSDA